MATSSNIFSTQLSTPPRSDSRVEGGVYSFAMPPPLPDTADESFVRLLIPSSLTPVREDLVFRFVAAEEGIRASDEEIVVGSSVDGPGVVGSEGRVSCGVGVVDTSSGM